MIEKTEQEIRRATRRSFLLFGAGAAGGIGILAWLKTRGEDSGALWPLRSVLEINERVARAAFNKNRLAPTFPVSSAREPRPNGDVGLQGPAPGEEWRLHVLGGRNSTLRSAGLLLDAVRSLPRVEMVTELKCIEGWSEIVQWAGARFSDFTAWYGPAAMTQYVAMFTPNADYYVGLDADSALHPQTLLAYEMNGAPLTSEHGAPLRLVIPVKYGIKSIKRIGSISYTDRRPADYWAEEGYDWYAGH